MERKRLKVCANLAKVANLFTLISRISRFSRGRLYTRRRFGANHATEGGGRLTGGA